MDVDTASASADADADSLSESSGDCSVASDGGATASAESTAEDKPAIYALQDLPRKSHHPDLTKHFPSVSKRRFTHIPERREMCFDSLTRLRWIRKQFGPRRRVAQKRCRSFRTGYLETLFELPFISEDNVIFSKPQKLGRSVDEVDQLMRKLDLHKDKK